MAGTVADMSKIVREIAEAEHAPTAQRAIERVARAIGLGYRRAFGFYYASARSVSAAEWIAAQDAVMATRRARAARLRAELAALETLTGETHADDLALERRAAGVDRRSMLGCGRMVHDAGR